jgi:ubiquinol-cytochrome c reductase cytochrome b subunit
MRWLKSVGEWLDRRLQLGAVIRETALHRVPRKSASWWYVFGSASLTVFILQVVTGILLALIYVPSAGEAWNSLQTLNQNIALGWFIRALHGWGSNFMVALVLIHLVQVFLFGAYKYPREFTWVVGVFLLLMTLGMAFTGQVLRFDQDAYWGLGIGASIMSRTPLLGGWLVNLMLGGPIIAGATLSRFFALHVFVIPGMLIGLVGLHLLMVVKLGINEWPMPGRLVRRETYLKEYEGRRAFRSGRHLEGPDFRRLHPAGGGGLRRCLRALRTNRTAGPYHHPNRSKTGFLFPLAVRCSLLAAAAA